MHTTPTRGFRFERDVFWGCGGRTVWTKLYTTHRIAIASSTCLSWGWCADCGVRDKDVNVYEPMFSLCFREICNFHQPDAMSCSSGHCSFVLLAFLGGTSGTSASKNYFGTVYSQCHDASNWQSRFQHRNFQQKQQSNHTAVVKQIVTTLRLCRGSGRLFRWIFIEFCMWKYLNGSCSTSRTCHRGGTK